MPVSGDAKLGSIKPDFVYGSSSIQILDDGGACAKMEIGDLGEVDAQFFYLDAENAVAMSLDAGWYQVDDYEFAYCQNELILPYGQAFLLDCQDSGSSVTYSGSVCMTSLKIELIDNFNFTGNVSPTAITLGDVLPDFVYGSSSIQILDDGGACAKMEIGDLGEVDAQFFYLDAENAAAMSLEAGWYQVDDYEFAYCMNSLVLKAGEGFLLDCQDSGSTIELPSAL